MLASGKRRPCCFAVVPFDLYKALGVAPRAKAHWGELPPEGRRDFILWIEAAKERETRRRRIQDSCEMLASGKRSPR